MIERGRWARALAAGAAAALLLSAALAIVDPRGDFVRAWLAYGVVAIICAWLLVAAWLRVGQEAPSTVMLAILVALALRLVVGTVLIRALPVAGYPTWPQQAGYVYWDAYKRDTDAWAISRMQDPLPGLAAARATSDQYLGMVTFSAGVYRLVSPDAHRPLVMVELAALASALGVLITWAFGRALLGDGVGRLAAWGMALYPEAVLLGSSQMREPFLIAFFAMGFYGYVLERQGLRRRGVGWMAAGVLLALPLSPPFALTLIATLVGAWLWEGRSGWKRRRLALVGAAGLAILALVLMARAWSSIGDLGELGPDAILQWWTHATDTWRMGLLVEGSPIIGFFLNMFPAWAQVPLITAYGLILPMLPAALADAANPVWWTIAVFRALGWTLLIPFLIAGFLLVIRQRAWKGIQGYLLVVIAVSALVAATRASSLQWDNPRYRAVFLTAQMVLAGWAWAESRRLSDSWLKRVAWIEAADLLLIQWWYAGRYWGLPNIGLARTLGGLVVVTLGLTGWFLLQDFRRRRRAGRLTPPVPTV
ncbi:MAG: hypothetical protein MUO35_08855 [Anaerolineales bacterium]|nr:hypothetical protein [Anaerolineales bacterium]